MKHYLRLKSLLLLLIAFSYSLSAQQHVAVISRCGGVDTVVIPNITDNDHDGMDDRLEQKLLDKFMPILIQFSDESCSGPALDGTGDSNLIVSHIYPIPQQYARSTSYDSLQIHPVPMVGPRALVPGLLWYDHLVKVNTAVLYGQDCGLLGHTADVEGFNFSLKYVGPDSAAGWMYDTLMNRWIGVTIQSISHAGTACQQVETLPYKSYLAPTGKDTVYASPDKHGNYLTTGTCGSSFICNPGCGNTQSVRHTRNINLGEPNATLVADLGSVYPGYAGEDPWTAANFLASHSGNAGAIRDKMIMTLSSTFIARHALTAAEICPLYARCYGPFQHSYSDNSCSNQSYAFHGRPLTRSGIYRDTLSNANGCDSIVSLTLTVYSYDTVPQNDFVCDGHAYDFHGTALVSSGVYRDTLSNMHGCDSTLILHLALHYPTTHIYSDHMCAGSSYDFYGQSLIAPGQYIDTITNVSGCDSVIQLSFTIDTPASVTWTAGTDTVVPHTHGILLNASPTGGLYSGSGVTGNVFYPDSAVQGDNIITYTYTDPLGCRSQASKTYYLSLPTGIHDIGLADAISVYPNPVNDMLMAQCDFFKNGVGDPVVSDMTGKTIILAPEYQADKIILHTGSLSAGMYMIKFSINGSSITKKFVKGE